MGGGAEVHSPLCRTGTAVRPHSPPLPRRTASSPTGTSWSGVWRCSSPPTAPCAERCRSGRRSLRRAGNGEEGEEEEEGEAEPTGAPPLLLTDAQTAAGAHGAAWLSPVLGDGGDADRAAEAGAALLDTDVLVQREREDGSEDRVAVLAGPPVLGFLPWAGL